MPVVSIEQLQKEAIQAWNDSGKSWKNSQFSEEMNKLFIRNYIDVVKAGKIMDKAFLHYMTGNNGAHYYILNAMIEIHNIAKQEEK